jgi:hypothetical protein
MLIDRRQLGIENFGLPTVFAASCFKTGPLQTQYPSWRALAIGKENAVNGPLQQICDSFTV